MRVIFWACLLLFISVDTFCQLSYSDSLLANLKKETNPSTRIVLEQKIADWFRKNSRYEEAIEMAEKSILTAREGTGDSLGVVTGLSILSNIYTNQEDFEKSFECIHTGKEAAEGNPLAQSYILTAEGLLYAILGEDDRAVENLHEALNNMDNPSADPLVASRIYYLLYGIYSERNDEANSAGYIEKAVQMSDLSGNKDDLANFYMAKAVVNVLRYQNTRTRAFLDSAINLLDEGIKLFKSFPDQVTRLTYSYLLVNKASYYLDYFDRHNPKTRNKIIRNIREVLFISEGVLGYEVVTANAYGIRSQLSFESGDLKTAENDLLSAYVTIKKMKKPYLHTLTNILTGLANVYEQRSEYQKALNYREEAEKLNDRLFDEEMDRSTKILESRYQFNQKEREIAYLKDKTESDRKMKNLLKGLAFVGLAGVFFMFRSYHFKLRYSLSKEKQLKVDQKEAETQIRLEQKEKERLKAEKELLKLEQERLEDEMMTSQLHLSHKNEVLAQLKEEFSQEEVPDIDRIFDDISAGKSAVHDEAFSIQELHPNFFSRLSEKTEKKLTPLDLKYCAYLYLGMDTKQIALLLNVVPKSVRMTKYRLKKKLGLDETIDLTNYLKKIG